MAGKAVPALDYVAEPDKYTPPAVCAVFGDERFLRQQAILCLREAVLGGGDADFSLTTFDGGNASFRDVHEVLSTVAMFGGGKRLVVVEEADGFVSEYRSQLEDYVARPSRSGVLILDLDSLPGTTRLYKSIAAGGLLIDCGTPTEARLSKWLTQWAKQRHRVQLPQAAAEMLVELVGAELGLLDQELARLALMVGDDKKISAELVDHSVGSWRAKTTWEMLDAALDGNVCEALRNWIGCWPRASNRWGCWGRFPPRSAVLPPPRGWCCKPRPPSGASISARRWNRLARAPSCCKGPSGNCGFWGGIGAPNSTAGCSRPIWI